jgi:hypothetical protein
MNDEKVFACTKEQLSQAVCMAMRRLNKTNIYSFYIDPQTWFSFGKMAATQISRERRFY